MWYEWNSVAHCTYPDHAKLSVSSVAQSDKKVNKEVNKNKFGIGDQSTKIRGQEPSMD